MLTVDPRTPRFIVWREEPASLWGGKGGPASPGFPTTNQGVRGVREDREANSRIRVYATLKGVWGVVATYVWSRFCLPILPVPSKPLN